MIDRRILLASATTLAAFSAFRWLGLGGDASAAEKSGAETFEIEKTPEEWKKQLSPAQYNVLREAGTERPYSSPLNKEKRKGTFTCAGCDLPLFSSDTKFESGTGWPSFYQALPQCDHREVGSHLHDGADGDPVPPVRRSPRPRFRRRAEAYGAALLHERAGAVVQTRGRLDDLI